MKNIKDMDFEELVDFEYQLDLLHDSLDNLKKLIGVSGLEDVQSIYTSLHLTSYPDHVDSKRKEIQEQRRLNQEASDMAYDTLQDLDNSQK